MKERHDEIDVLLAQRSSTDFYPPVINQANLLAESGLKVLLIDGGKGPHGFPMQKLVKVERPMTKSSGYGFRLMKRAVGAITFTAAVRGAQRRLCPKVLIAYEPPAILSALSPGRFPGRTIYHLHEHRDLVYRGEKKADLQYRLTFSRLKKAEYVITADSHRAGLLIKQAGLAEDKTLTVRNCPRLMKERPQGGVLKKVLLSMNINPAAPVLFQGSIGESYYISEIIRSVKDWPREAALILIGRVDEECKKRLYSVAASAGVRQRVVFLGEIPYHRLFDYTVDAAAGLALVRPENNSFRYCAGAGNKRFEFMACGVPVIANKGPGMKKLVEDTESGICIDPEQPGAISRAVNDILTDAARARYMGQRGREAHLSRFNYETEFAFLRERIIQFCRGKTYA